MILVGLLGAAGAGKSTVAGHLEKYYGAKRYSLATPLKEITKRAFEFTDAQVYGTQQDKERIDPRYGQSPRWFLQRLGTQGIRDVLGADFWVEYLLQRIRDDRPELAVVDDVRFKNETKSIRSFADWNNDALSVIWRLESPVSNSSADATHQSEAEWSIAQYDYLIKPRARGLDELYTLVDQTCAQMSLRKVSP